MVNMVIAPNDVKYLHRRQYFRMDCCVPLSFSILRANKPEEMFSGEKNYGLIRDLSGGGMRIASEFGMTEQDSIQFIFHLDREFFHLIGGIRSQTHFPGSYLPYLHGIMFMGLSMQRREKIISYLHRCQLMSLRFQSRSLRHHQFAGRTYLSIPANHQGISRACST